MWTLAAVFVAVSTVLVGCQAVDYSTICTDHTMAIYPELGPLCMPTPESGTIMSGVSNEEKVRIVDEHNAYRRWIAQGLEPAGASGPQPPAADMHKLVWDEELAEVAQRWANQCSYGHDTCRTVDRFTVGQNLFRVLSSKNTPLVNWTRPISKWYGEVKDFNPTDITPFQFSIPTSHYTLMLWSKTKFIGCGFSYYNSTRLREARTPYAKYFVCNYGLGGNIINDTMYVNGEPCSKCPAGKTCDDFLCA